MSRKKQAQETTTNLRLSPPELWRLEFVRNENTADFPVDSLPPVLFGLGLNRFAHNKVGVELSVEIKDFPPVSIAVSYRAVFELEGAEAGPQVETDLRYVAAQVAPAALYPFIREAVSSAALKAGLPPIVPPIVNFRTIFNPSEVTLPPIPESDSANAE